MVLLCVTVAAASAAQSPDTCMAIRMTLADVVKKDAPNRQELVKRLNALAEGWCELAGE